MGFRRLFDNEDIDGNDGTVATEMCELQKT
jgi:hypothetical protein